MQSRWHATPPTALLFVSGTADRSEYRQAAGAIAALHNSKPAWSVVADWFGRAVTVKTFPSRITTYLPR
jgi:hypothetical protein